MSGVFTTCTRPFLRMCLAFVPVYSLPGLITYEASQLKALKLLSVPAYVFYTAIAFLKFASKAVVSPLLTSVQKTYQRYKYSATDVTQLFLEGSHLLFFGEDFIQGSSPS